MTCARPTESRPPLTSVSRPPSRYQGRSTWVPELAELQGMLTLEAPQARPQIKLIDDWCKAIPIARTERHGFALLCLPILATRSK